jgi:hypothetical protein
MKPYPKWGEESKNMMWAYLEEIKQLQQIAQKQANNL